jgi:hypothetical protein
MTVLERELRLVAPTSMGCDWTTGDRYQSVQTQGPGSVKAPKPRRSGILGSDVSRSHALASDDLDDRSGAGMVRTFDDVSFQFFGAQELEGLKLFPQTLSSHHQVS